MKRSLMLKRRLSWIERAPNPERICPWKKFAIGLG